MQQTLRNAVCRNLLACQYTCHHGHGLQQSVYGRGVQRNSNHCGVRRIGVYLSVCGSVSVCPPAYLRNRNPNFTEFSVHVACGRGSLLLWWCCNTLCISGLCDDVMFSYCGPNVGVTLLQQRRNITGKLPKSMAAIS